MAKVKLGDVAREYKSTVREAEGLPIVGLEHLLPGEITLTQWSDDTDTTFTKGFKKGQMLFGRRRAYLKKAAVAPFDGICSGDITVIEAIPEKLSPDLLPFIIQNDRLFDFAVEKSAGSLSPRVKWEHLKNYEFELPEMEHQRALVDLLWAMTRTKKAYQELVKKTDELVKSQFIEMFGDPTDNPKGWPVLSFDEVASIDANMTTDYERYANYPHIGIDSIEKDTGTLFGYRTVKEDNVISGKYVFGPQHIIYSKIRPALNKVALPDFEGLCSADAYPILPKEGICIKEFLAHVLRSDYFLRYILAFSGRSQMPKVNRKQIAGFKFPVPPIDQQEEFVRFVKQSDKSKFELKHAIDRIDEMIRALMKD